MRPYLREYLKEFSVSQLYSRDITDNKKSWCAGLSPLASLVNQHPYKVLPAEFPFSVERSIKRNNRTLPKLLKYQHRKTRKKGERMDWKTSFNASSIYKLCTADTGLQFKNLNDSPPLRHLFIFFRILQKRRKPCYFQW